MSLGKISSGPEAFLGLRFLRRFSVPLVVIEIFGIWFMFFGLNPRNQSSSSARNFKLRALGLENRLILFIKYGSMLGWICIYVYVDPSDLGGEIQVFSVPLCLI